MVLTPADNLPHRTLGFRGVPRFTRHRCDVRGLGLERHTDPGRYHWDNHDRTNGCLLQVTLTGEGRFRDDARGRSWALTAGRAMLVEMPSPTAYWLPRGKTWQFAWAMLTGDMAFYHVRRLVAEHGNVLRLAPGSEPVQTLIELYRAVLETETPDETDLAVGAYRLLMEMDRALQQPARGLPEPVRAAQRYINTHLHDPALDVDAVAAAAGYSRYHFSRLFKHHTGMSPHRYLLHTRMRRALTLLVTTEQSVKQISAHVGFHDPSHFGAAFRKHVGRSPQTVRHEQQQLDVTDTRTV